VVFNSTSFLAFFLILYACYRILGQRYVLQNKLLLLASYVFYGFWDWRFPCLMAVTTVVDYMATKAMHAYPEKRRAYLVLSLVNNLGVLFILKYFDFFQTNVLSVLHQLGINGSPLLLGLILPVGISFYTFQRLTFVIDVYREEDHAEVGFLDFALFVSFFPLLLSGPIERAKQMMPQLMQPRNITGRHWEEGIWLVSWGLFKKVYVADNLAALVDPVFAEGWHGSGGEALVAVYAYAFQIYCDFSGYSDVARGIATLLGFDVRWNFNLPYFASNPSDFWRRWHMSLSTWLRDYVFIPLGGSRQGTWQTNRNLMITMILVGLWHGAAWTFVLWGLYHGLLLILYPLISPERRTDQRPTNVRAVVNVALMFHFTCLGWLLFRASSLQQATDVFLAIASSLPTADLSPALLGQLCGYIAILLVVQSWQWVKGNLLVLDRASVALKGMVYGILFYLTILHGGTSNSFIYFQF
jgi:alginate O-acetyltransferase complex protein AlgI